LSKAAPTELVSALKSDNQGWRMHAQRKLVERGKAALQRLEDGLEETQFLVGDSVSLADVSLVAYTRVAHEGGFDLADYPRVTLWVARVEAALGIA